MCKISAEQKASLDKFIRLKRLNKRFDDSFDYGNDSHSASFSMAQRSGRNRRKLGRIKSKSQYDINSSPKKMSKNLLQRKKSKESINKRSRNTAKKPTSKSNSKTPSKKSKPSKSRSNIKIEVTSIGGSPTKNNKS
jgi:hypothetical protein